MPVLYRLNIFDTVKYQSTIFHHVMFAKERENFCSNIDNEMLQQKYLRQHKINTV